MTVFVLKSNGLFFGVKNRSYDDEHPNYHVYDFVTTRAIADCVSFARREDAENLAGKLKDKYSVFSIDIERDEDDWSNRNIASYRIENFINCFHCNELGYQVRYRYSNLAGTPVRTEEGKTYASRPCKCASCNQTFATCAVCGTPTQGSFYGDYACDKCTEIYETAKQKHLAKAQKEFEERMKQEALMREKERLDDIEKVANGLVTDPMFVLREGEKYVQFGGFGHDSIIELVEIQQALYFRKQEDAQKIADLINVAKKNFVTVTKTGLKPRQYNQYGISIGPSVHAYVLCPHCKQLIYAYIGHHSRKHHWSVTEHTCGYCNRDFHTCRDCGKTFTIDQNEQNWLDANNYSTPIRCRDCRSRRRKSGNYY